MHALRIRTVSLLAMSVLASAGIVRAQQPANDGDVTQLSVELVRVDAVVTDEQGRRVTGLTAEDFEILEDGKPQQIIGLQYVASGAAPPPAAGSGATAGAPPSAPSADRIKRTIAFVVDDLFLSAEVYPKIKFSMREFVEKQMQPGDLVAIIRTSGGSTVMQQFSSDKREILAEIDRIHWNSQGAKGASSFAPPDESILNNRPAFRGARSGGRRGDAFRIEQAKRFAEQAETRRSQRLAVAMLGTLGETVTGLDTLPGRKSVVLFSEGFRALSNEFVRTYELDNNDRAPQIDAFGTARSGAGDRGVLNFLKNIVDRANRAAVSIYAIDPRGVVDPSFTSSQNGTLVLDRENRDRYVGEQRDEYMASSTALHFLADQTGGEVTSSNDLGYGIRRAVDDLGAYYAIDYEPQTTFGDKQKPVFHEIAVRVKRPGARVRARSGFYGVTDADIASKRSLSDRVGAALTSPFGSNEISVHVAAQCVSADDAKPTVRTVVRAEPDGLQFAKAADGANEATVNVFAVLLGADGSTVAKAEKTHAVHVTDAELERLRREGLTFVINMPAAKAGAYRVRAAVRDAASDRIGAAGQFVEIPNLKSGEFAISGIVLGSESGRFLKGTELTYGFVAYNAKTEKDAPQLAMQFAIWRDGKQLFESPVQDLAFKPQANWRVINIGGGFGIKDRMQPGEYQLKITVVDKLAEDTAATEWTDFEVLQ